MEKRMIYLISSIVACLLCVGYIWKKDMRQYNYQMVSFNTDDMKFLMFDSVNGVDFLQRKVEYIPKQGNGTVRDPSCIWRDGKYYVVYTTIAWDTGNQIGMFTTRDFSECKEREMIKVGEYNKVWAPTFYQEADQVYIIYNAAYEDEKFSSYIVPYNIEKHAIGEAIKIEGLPDNVIDTEIYKVEGKYYLFYKNEDTKYVEMATSNQLNGPYQVVGEDDWASWGNTLEGPCLVSLPKGYRLYLDNYEEHQIYYTESDDLLHWTKKRKITPSNIAHSCVMYCK